MNASPQSTCQGIIVSVSWQYVEANQNMTESAHRKGVVDDPHHGDAFVYAARYAAGNILELDG